MDGYMTNVDQEFVRKVYCARFIRIFLPFCLLNIFFLDQR